MPFDYSKSFTGFFQHYQLWNVNNTTYMCVEYYDAKRITITNVHLIDHNIETVRGRQKLTKAMNTCKMNKTTKV